MDPNPGRPYAAVLGEMDAIPSRRGHRSAASNGLIATSKASIARAEQDTRYAPTSRAALAAATRGAGRRVNVAGDAPVSRRPHRFGARRSAAAADTLTVSEGAADRSSPAAASSGTSPAAPLKIAGVITGLPHTHNLRKTGLA